MINPIEGKGTRVLEPEKSRKDMYSTSLVQLYNLISTRPAVQIMSRIQCMLHEIYLSSHLVCMIKG